MPWNILQSTHNRPDYIPPPLLAADQIVCGPEYSDVSTGERVLSVKTGLGEYDIADVVKRLPTKQRPNLVIVRSDSTCRNRPMNIAGLGCPAILLVGDTHHQSNAIGSTVDYALSQPFTSVIVDFTRQHAHFFADAGVEHVYWLPGFNVRRVPRLSAGRLEFPMSFVGQTGAHHSRRRAVIEALQQAGLPIKATLILKPLDARNVHARSLLSFNCSLNGDLNLRIFEIMMSGSCLLTDRLGLQSGLDLLFDQSHHLVCYSSITECIEKARDLLHDTGRAAMIAKSGHKAYEALLAPERIAADFFALIDKGTIRTEFDLTKDPRMHMPRNRDRSALKRRIAIYEFIQDTQLRNEKTFVVATPGIDPHILADVSDLARVSVAVDMRGAPPLAEALITFLSNTGISDYIEVGTGIGEVRHNGQTILLATAADWRQRQPPQETLIDNGATLLITDLDVDPAVVPELTAAGLRRLSSDIPAFARPEKKQKP